MNRRGPAVAVTIVTYNSAKYIRKCLEYVFCQDYPNIQVVVVDNASSDNTLAELDSFQDRITTIRNQQNTGFASGQNQAIAASHADWVLALNPDVRLQPDFVSNLVRASERSPEIGTLCGKLLTMQDNFEIPESPVFDSTGIYMTRNCRHLDRGSQMPDNGAFENDEYVFGATGAAALYRRKMIDDISVDGEFFRLRFFRLPRRCRRSLARPIIGMEMPLYSERLGVITSAACLPLIASESRHPEHAFREEPVSARIKNATGDLYRRNWLAHDDTGLRRCRRMLAHGVVFAAGLPAALPRFSTHLGEAPQIMRRRRVSNDYIASWFSGQPSSVLFSHGRTLSRF